MNQVTADQKAVIKKRLIADLRRIMWSETLDPALRPEFPKPVAPTPRSSWDGKGKPVNGGFVSKYSKEVYEKALETYEDDRSKFYRKRHAKMALTIKFLLDSL